MENLLYFLILFPFGIAALQSVSSNNNLRRAVTYIGTAAIMTAAGVFSVWWYRNGAQPLVFLSHTEELDRVMALGEIFLMLLITVLSVKYKKYYAIVLSWVQTCAILWFEFFGGKRLTGFEPSEARHFYVDQLTVIMILIIAIVGTLITVYACGYMVDYHNHHTDFKDRRRFFFSMMYIFIGAMFGLVLSSNLSWMYFFWEITSVISFLMIGYTKTSEAVNNGFKALWMNLLGGCGFCVAIIWLGMRNGIYDIRDLIEYASVHGNQAVVAPVILLAFAALTKSAQMPFSSWLLGAMVAPTPSSALLHSATMVKAGVYLLIRLAPAMQGSNAGHLVALIGGFTFLVASMLAITVTDAKKLLAYSTISNLGLIASCAGLGTTETLWAGIFLLVFHAVSKSLLFQTVGAIENLTGSRDIEDMHSLVIRFPRLAYPLIIGIAGMFLAPFGMLVSKWAALRSFIDADNKLVGITLVLFICYGSATTLFYWAKWLAKILSYKPQSTICTSRINSSQYSSIALHSFAMLFLCILFPIISKDVIIPYLVSIYGTASEVISQGNIFVMMFMLVTVFLIPFLIGFIVHKYPPKKAEVYISGYNYGDDLSFPDAFGNQKRMYLTNWYMNDIFGEKKLFTPSVVISSAGMIIIILFTVGGAF